MNYDDPIDINPLQYDHAVAIADGIWWVGFYMENDVFQCHPYLIEHGDQSVLLDPGSSLTFNHTLRKIEEVIPFSKIRYFVCHHQDPDITGVLPLIDKLISRDDAVIVTHWRAMALLKHYALKTPFWLVEEHEWKLDLGGRLLRFVYTPYLHFPGAFVTFDTDEGVLFSSDIFGGFSENWSLVAKDESVFDGIRLFHEHYMPSREILIMGLSKLEALPIKIIAPQHGSIIPPHLVGFIMGKLKGIDCGLYLLSETETGIHRLSLINRILRDIMETMVIYRDFHDIANAITEIARRVLPVATLEFYAVGDDGAVIYFSPANRYRAVASNPDSGLAKILGVDRKSWITENTRLYKEIDMSEEVKGLVIPLFSPVRQVANAIAIFYLDHNVPITEDISQMLKHLDMPLEVALEREFIYQRLDMERQKIYDQSIKDQLTGLYNRIYMRDTTKRLFSLNDRDDGYIVALIMFDIDHFKKINDTFGHVSGDEVLRKVAEELINQTRKSDLAVRLGGEEFIVFLVGLSVCHALETAERIRTSVSELQFDGDMKNYRVTISAGLTFRKQQENLDDCIHRADVLLYQAKNGGRNRTCSDIP
ncbi:MAG: diguanylate cyclase [Nitrospirae bacterium]|nr:diguanylate cyclase [Nitrospirota bacterium]